MLYHLTPTFFHAIALANRYEILDVRIGNRWGDTVEARQPQKPVSSDEEFRAAVMGKTQEEVLNLLGRPDRTTEFSDGPYWVYEKRTFDPISQKVDSSVGLSFDADHRVRRGDKTYHGPPAPDDAPGYSARRN